MGKRWEAGGKGGEREGKWQPQGTGRETWEMEGQDESHGGKAKKNSSMKPPTGRDI